MKDLQCPVNILAGPGSPTVPELQKLGVARVSVGSGAMRTTLGLLRRIAEELKSAGTYATLDGAITFADVNRMMESISIVARVAAGLQARIRLPSGAGHSKTSFNAAPKACPEERVIEWALLHAV